MELMETLQSHGEQTALVHGETTYSYARLVDRIGEYEKLLQESGVQQGDVAALVGDYSFETIAMLLALHLHRCIIVPVTSELQSEQRQRFEEAFCRLAIFMTPQPRIEKLSCGDTHPMIEKLRQARRSGLVLFSSGSTGKPKAMIHDLDRLIAHYENKRGKRLYMLLFLLFDHIGGLNTLLNALFMGAAMVVPPSREPEAVCALIERYKIRVLPSSPTFLNLLLISGMPERFDLSSLRMITYGTEAMPESLLKRLKSAFPKAKLLQTFGTSETGIAATSSKSSESTYMKLDDPNLEHRIVEKELWLRSGTQVMGYLNASMESFTEDGWFKTGDLVEEVGDGYLKIIGRSKEVINVGGEKVLPVEVESLLLQMPEVEDVMVHAAANAITGQSVAADIVPAKPTDAKSLKKAVRRFCKGKLEGYKIPTKVQVVEKTNFGGRFKKMRCE